ncbi:DUF4936 family protein [Massilia suwonensis]|uniref:DUF4936 family protein n=1 Tax=Massilia suwonensis TaxID=648895 RepID=A0ABW0MJZ0_9BURK
MVDLYVYYKVRDEDAERLAHLVCALQTRVIQPGHARLLRRPESKDGLQTWMEVYPDVPESFAATLEDAVAGAGLDGLLQGPRHVEVFTEIPPCA